MEDVAMEDKIIVGRNGEKKRLNRLLTSKEPEFMAIYGRRRVGKTFLIRNYFANKGFYFELSLRLCKFLCFSLVRKEVYI